MQAIETHYKGYRFRSRLEARWAVFFDAMGVKWLFEHEGFELPSGRYLPDFLLPDLDLWVEIKPEAPDEREREKCLDLMWATGKAVFASHGLPDEGGTLFWESVGDGSSGVNEDPAWLTIRPWTLQLHNPTTQEHAYESRWSVTPSFIPAGRRSRPFLAAADKAKSARFEFGESGA